MKTGGANSFRAAVEKIALAARIKPFTGEVKGSLNDYRPRRVGELEGTFKIILDSLKGSAFVDDKQIVEIYAKRHEDKLNPSIEI